MVEKKQASKPMPANESCPVKVLKKLQTQSQELERRLSGLEAVTRFTVNVQIDQLAAAERLRKLAAAVIASSNFINPKNGTVDSAKGVALAVFLRQCKPFYRPVQGLKAALKKLRKARP